MGVNDGKLQAWALAVGPGSQWWLFPALQPGVHLRWALRRDLGFPWGGFFVLSRSRTASLLTQGPASSWAAVGGISQPIALPVIANGYPAGKVVPLQSGKTEAEASSAYGFARVAGPLKGSLQARFGELFPLLRQLVAGGGEAGAMASRSWHPGEDAAAEANSPRLARQSLLDLALLGAAHPEYAQLIGLYAVDPQAIEAPVPGSGPPNTLDYLIIADCRAVFGGQVAAALAWANGGCHEGLGVHARLVQDVRLTPCGKLPPPKAMAAYLVPTTTSPVPGKANAVTGSAAAAALVWDCDPLTEVAGDGPLWPNLFQVRRATLPAPAQVPADLSGAAVDLSAAKFQPIHPGDIEWHLVSARREPPARGATVPGDWPPWSPQFFDGRLGEGWHAWRVMAMDWFGRRSLPSDPAQWRHWSPRKLQKVPLGGFGKMFAKLPGVAGGGDALVHPWAMLVLDKTPPPSPSGLALDVLDTADEWHYDKAWAEANAALVKGSTYGARIRWSWPYAATRQAPDLNEFRVYFRSGASGVWRGNVQKAWTATNDLKGNCGIEIGFVDKGLPDDGDLVGATLRLGGTAAKVESAQTGAICTTILVNLPAPHTAESVEIGSPCTVVAAGKQAEGSVDVTAAPWQRVLAVPKAAGKNVFEVFRADDGQPYELPLLEVLPDGIPVGLDTPLNAVFTGLWQLAVVGTLADSIADWANAKIFGIVGVDLDERIVFTEPKPGVLQAPVGWTRAYLGQAKATYECFLDLEALVPAPPASQPKAWFEVAVSAADGVAHTPDWCSQPQWGNRPGNESEVAGPLRGERLGWVLPEKVEAIWGDGELKASPADVDGRSFFTVRWKATDAPVRVLRAAAVDVFRADWEAGGKGLVGDPLSKLLGQFKDLKAPDLAVLGGRKSFAPIAAAYAELDAKVQQGIASGVDAAGAFLPVTVGAISTAMAPDLVGPDSAADYKPQVGVCAFVDTLDGLVAGRWFYGICAAEPLGSATGAGLVSPPVCAIDKRPPDPPIILTCGIADAAWQLAQADAGVDDALKLIGALGQCPAVLLAWRIEAGVEKWEIVKENGGVITTAATNLVVANGVALWTDTNTKPGVTKYSVVSVCADGRRSVPSSGREVQLAG